MISATVRRRERIQRALVPLMGGLVFVLMATEPGLAQTPASQATTRLDTDECDVWRREMSFAQSVEKHDAKAFAAHIHPGAVFSAATKAPVRGREAVVKDWARLIEGKELRLRWRPDVVNIGGDRNVAISRGPYVLEDNRPDAKARYRVGTFTSVWVRQPMSGEWLVLFDGGGPPGTQVKDAQTAEEFISRAPASCPAR
jgi:ketosteroid isomerase-like protein